MHAVCPGSSSCQQNTPRCFVTPLSTPGCSYLDSLSEKMCNYGPKQCPEIDNMFVFMHGWGDNSELGVVGNTYYAQGKNYVSGEGGQHYFAYCVICGDCSGTKLIIFVINGK